MNTVLCACGSCHSPGAPCERAEKMLECSHEHAHEHAGPLDPAPLPPASAFRAVYRIANMDCPMEENLIRKKLAGMPGIDSLSFNLMQRVLIVEHSLPSSAGIEAALNSIDMKPEAVHRQPATMAAAPPIPWRRLALAGVFALAAELSELTAHWWGSGATSGLAGGAAMADWLPLSFAVIAILLAGFTTYRKGWIAVRNLNLNINALMSVAVSGALLIGQYPEAAMVMVLFNLAEAIEAKSLDKARHAIKNLLSLAPEKATMRLDNGSWQETDIGQIALGSCIRVKPGERVALDGIIVKGQSTINQAPITGESLPVEKGAGDHVYAGTINEAGSFEFTVSALAGDSTLARIIHAVEEAQGGRAPMQRFVDRFSRIYTPAIFLSALLVAVLPPLLLAGAWAEWIYTALVILVIGCPCALVISTPVTIVSAMAAATRHGMLIKGGIFLEQGRQLKWLALDKTGTITHGKPQQTDVMALAAMDKERVVALAASLASRSDHPVSQAIARAAARAAAPITEVSDFKAIAGQGVSGRITGQKYWLGSHRLVENFKQCSPELEATVLALEAEGKSVVMLLNENRVQGLFAVADTVKESSIEAIARLKRMGIKTMMLSGDNRHSAQAIAALVGVDEFQANLLPQDKLATLEKLGATGKVGMVGDGINDAPALARADIGFAMAAAGTDTAIETADVALMDDDLRKIPRFIRLSQATYAILIQNIIFALSVKALFFALTFMGLATMWMAVFADVGAALVVVANGLRAMGK